VTTWPLTTSTGFEMRFALLLDDADCMPVSGTREHHCVNPDHQAQLLRADTASGQLEIKLGEGWPLLPSDVPHLRPLGPEGNGALRGRIVGIRYSRVR
jgi:hypothetical protein